MKVFVVQHAYMKVSENYFGIEEDVKFIGVFSTEEKAKEAVARLQKQPGFINWQRGFHIDSYTLDQDHWSEGFVPFIGGYHQCQHSKQNLGQTRPSFGRLHISNNNCGANPPCALCESEAKDEVK